MNDLDVLLLVIVCIAVGYFIGIVHVRIRMMNALVKIMHSEEKGNSNFINVYVEERQDELFIFNAETHEYMAHSSNTNDLIENLKKRYPNKQYMASTEDFAKLAAKEKK
jgi:hypothetical protein